MTILKLGKTSIALIAVATLFVVGTHAKVEELNTFSEEKSLNLKTCAMVQLGFDYLLSSVEKMFEQYAHRFNMQFEEQHRGDHPQKKSTYQDNIFAGNLHFKVARDTEWIGDANGLGRGGHAFINYSKSSSDDILVIGVPYVMETIERVYNMHTKDYVHEVIIRGVIEF